MTWHTLIYLASYIALQITRLSQHYDFYLTFTTIIVLTNKAAAYQSFDNDITLAEVIHSIIVMIISY